MLWPASPPGVKESTRRTLQAGIMMNWLLLLTGLLLPRYTSAGGSVSVNIKDLGAIEGIQSLDIRGAKWQ